MPNSNFSILIPSGVLLSSLLVSFFWWGKLAPLTCVWFSDFFVVPQYEYIHHFFSVNFYGIGMFYRILAHWLPLLSV
jgi:hypothetical protein